MNSQWSPSSEFLSVPINNSQCNSSNQPPISQTTSCPPLNGWFWFLDPFPIFDPAMWAHRTVTWRHHCTTHGTQISQSEILAHYLFFFLLGNCTFVSALMAIEKNLRIRTLIPWPKFPPHRNPNAHFFMNKTSNTDQCVTWWTTFASSSSMAGFSLTSRILNQPPFLIYCDTVSDWTLTWLNNASASEKSVVPEDFPEFSKCVFSQLHRSWAVFIFCPRLRRGFFHFICPAFPLLLNLDTL